MNIENTELLHTDVLIIGGGTAGCYAALTVRENSPITRVIIAEKANIKRSGCLSCRCQRNQCLYCKRQKAGRLCGVCEEGCGQHRTGGSAAHNVRGVEPCDGEDGDSLDWSS